MPKPEFYQHRLKNYADRVPLVVYFDLEFLLVAVAGFEPNTPEYNTQIFKQPQYCGYGLSVLEHGKPDVVRYQLKEEHLFLT